MSDDRSLDGAVASSLGARGCVLTTAPLAGASGVVASVAGALTVPAFLTGAVAGVSASAGLLDRGNLIERLCRWDVSDVGRDHRGTPKLLGGVASVQKLGEETGFEHDTLNTTTPAIGVCDDASLLQTTRYRTATGETAASRCVSTAKAAMGRHRSCCASRQSMVWRYRLFQGTIDVLTTQCVRRSD